jgi:hypothetical protein
MTCVYKNANNYTIRLFSHGLLGGRTRSCRRLLGNSVFRTFQMRHWVARRPRLWPSSGSPHSGWDTSLWLGHWSNIQSYEKVCKEYKQCVLVCKHSLHRFGPGLCRQSYSDCGSSTDRTVWKLPKLLLIKFHWIHVTLAEHNSTFTGDTEYMHLIYTE